ncbi:MAG: undecaprenyldiphospho-muramoylpentapeptide beta-N-acetylglucosaminyltransferase [Clostridiales bacterium]|nr:undecaprenyldiphospho-muramoylpentapeptide beta-N-acetylglucosaminyltransferase [Clostridiales bacterium]
MATIILTGGGTAGHCTPNLALLPYLKNDFDKIVYIGSENGIEKNIIENTDIPYYAISCAKLERKTTIKNLTLPFKVVKGILQAGKILDKIKPDVIFSKGGYVSIPTVIAAAKRKISVISHESDYTVGLANKISAHFSKKVLTSFPETAISLKNGEYVGPPIRKTIINASKAEALKMFGFNGQKPIILVTGGSQGAKAINEALRNALPLLLSKYDILHICGKNNLTQEKTPKGYFQTEYMNKIENAFAVASICVSRSGSNTLFELMSLKMPCVLIPLPKGNSRGDQVQNAEYFQKLGLAHVLQQDALTAESLAFAINAVYANRLNLSRNFQKFPIKDASRQISRIIADYVH